MYSNETKSHKGTFCTTGSVRLAGGPAEPLWRQERLRFDPGRVREGGPGSGGHGGDPEAAGQLRRAAEPHCRVPHVDQVHGQGRSLRDVTRGQGPQAQGHRGRTRPAGGTETPMQVPLAQPSRRNEQPALAGHPAHAQNAALQHAHERTQRSVAPRRRGRIGLAQKVVHPDR